MLPAENDNLVLVEQPEPSPPRSTWHGMKPQFSPTVSIGNLATIFGILVPLALWAINQSMNTAQRIATLSAAVNVESAVRSQQIDEQKSREQADVANLQAELDADSTRSQSQLNEIKAILQDIQHRIDNRWERVTP